MWPEAFAGPVGALAWAAVVAALLLAAWLWRLRRSRGASVIGRSAAVVVSALPAGLPRTWAARARALPDVLRVAALVCGAVALAGPVVWRPAHERLGGADVMLLIDVSPSMAALDFTPDRLGAARRFAEQVLDRRPGDRIGLVTFASRTALRCPLTRDHAAVRAAIRDLVPGEERLGEGTAIGAAIVTATERLAQGDAGDRLIILLSDGASVREQVDPGEAAALAASRRVHIHAVGIGSGGAVPYPTEFGPVDVVLPLDAEALRAIAARTGGQYYPAPDDAALRAVSEALDEIEAPVPVEVVESRAFTVGQAWVLAALACVTLELVLAGTALRRFPG